MVTLLPDYLYRRYVQGKRLGKEITFYSVWFELRWSTSNVTIFFRTVSILPET
ncbi:MAG: HlyD family secretion protein, partial [Pseudolabrys sp.]